MLRDERRRRTRPTSCHRLRPAVGPEDAADPRARELRRARPSTPPQWRHDVDLAGKRVAVIGTGCSAIQVVPGDPADVAQLDVYQRSPGWTFPKMDFAYSERAQRLFERFPALQRLDRAADLRVHGARRAGDDQPPLAAARRSARSAAGRSTRRSTDPELRRKVTPTDEIGCKRMMLTDEWYPTLTKPNVELVTERIAEVTPGGIRTADGSERPADVLVLATGFKTHGFVAPMEIVGAGGRTLAEEWAEVPRAYLGHERARLPEHVPALRAEHERRHRLGDLHDRGRHRPRDRRAARARARAARDGSRSAARRPRRSTASCARRSRGTVWHTGCTNWYVDENGNDPNQWPWLWSTYRRRTAALEPGAYELTRRPAPVEVGALGLMEIERTGADPRRSRRRTPAASSRAASPATSGSSRWRSRTTHARGRIVVDRRHLHPGGFVHGGVWTALGDTVAAWATFRSIPPRHNFTTIELKLNVFGAGLPRRRDRRRRRAAARRPQHGRDRGQDRAHPRGRAPSSPRT